MGLLSRKADPDAGGGLAARWTRALLRFNCRRFFSRHGFLSHLHSYCDEAEILPSSIHPICLMRLVMRARAAQREKLAARAICAARLLGAVDTPYAGRDQRDPWDNVGSKFLSRFVGRNISILGEPPRMTPQRDTASAKQFGYAVRKFQMSTTLLLA